MSQVLSQVMSGLALGVGFSFGQAVVNEAGKAIRRIVWWVKS